MSQLSEAAELLPSPLRRLLYSLLAWSLAALLIAPVASLVEVSSSPGEALIEVVQFYTQAILLYSFPGWVLAIPLVLLVSNLQGWRLWVVLSAGMSIGPLLALCVLGWPPSKLFHGLATADSIVSTLLYALLLHFDLGVKRLSA